MSLSELKEEKKYLTMLVKHYKNMLEKHSEDQKRKHALKTNKRSGHNPPHHEEDYLSNSMT